MILNDAGQMVQAVWDEIPGNYDGVETDVFVIMPNHVHGIVVIVGAGPCACPNHGQPRGVAPTVLSLPDVVHRFKTLSTKRYVDGVKQHNWKSFDKKLWQRNYYEHIIRDETELNKIREYIINNPLNWQTDDENPYKQQASGIEIWHERQIDELVYKLYDLTPEEIEIVENSKTK